MLYMFVLVDWYSFYQIIWIHLMIIYINFVYFLWRGSACSVHNCHDVQYT